MSSIESLPFLKDRIELAGSDGFQINRIQAQDRTVAVVRKWQTLNAELRAARRDTLECCEAMPGKGNSVNLSIVDKDRFDSLQASIEAHNKQIAALEAAIRALDAQGGLWFSELEDTAAYLGRSEGVENRQIATMTAGYLQRRANSGKTPDQILAEDPDFQRLKNLCESRIKVSKEAYAIEKPKLEALRAILESVGC